MSEAETKAEGEPEAEPGEPRRRRGGPRPKPAHKRLSRTITVNLSTPDWNRLKEIAATVDMPVRAYVRTRALGLRLKPRKHPSRLSPTVLDAASTLSTLARELEEMAEASATGARNWPSPLALRQLAERAHVAGVSLIGMRPDAA